MDFLLTEEADVEAVQMAVREGIRSADPPEVGARDWRELALAIREPGGAMLGGLYGATMWGWLLIDGLWIAEAVRRRGLGRRLMEAAEIEAIKRGCQHSSLGTFDFQARGFYERLGYTMFAERSR